MTKIEKLLVENSNRPEVQQKIREAAQKGAENAGFSLIVGCDNTVKFGDVESYEHQDEAIDAALDYIYGDVPEFWQIFGGNAEYLLQDINSQLNAPETESQQNAAK